MRTRNSQSRHAGHGDLACGAWRRSHTEPLAAKMRRAMLLLLIPAALTSLALPGRSQALSESGNSFGPAATTTIGQMDLTYVRPTERTKVDNYLFDAFGPYPLAGAAVVAGINQFSNKPREWDQGVEGYAKRFGSDYAIAAASTTTRYALSEAFKEDSLYYRCDCRGAFPRLRHAILSTLTARRGQDGHRVFSLPALVGPYAGSTIAIYGWYPNRYGAKDAFRAGNYSMLTYVGGNIALEFFYSGPHSLRSRMHLNNTHGSSVQGPNQ
jgi:hypothetical protein